MTLGHVQVSLPESCLTHAGTRFAVLNSGNETTREICKSSLQLEFGQRLVKSHAYIKEVQLVQGASNSLKLVHLVTI